MDTITVNLKIDNKSYFINCTYCPPNGNLNLFIQDFTKILEDRDIICLGDSNIDLSKNDRIATEYISELESLGYMQNINEKLAL